MYPLAMYGKTEDDNFFEWLQPFLPWISEKLEVSSDDLIRVRNSSLNALVQAILKKTICAGQDTVITGRVHRLSAVAGSKLGTCELHPSLDNHVVNFSSTTSKADWMISSNHMIAAIRFDELDCPVIFIRTQVQAFGKSWEDTIAEFICAKKDIHSLVSYLQGLERSAGAVMLHVMDGSNQEISALSWDGVVLDANIDEMVRQDFTSFLTERKKTWFKSKGLPYRRGYLFHGPPGNGKTSLIRSMLTHAKLPAYTMKNFGTNEAVRTFETMFEEAAKNEQAIIILEDIDRSFSAKGNSKDDSEKTSIPFSTFLNCLDGVGNQEGLILIATANNPRNLDMAVLERPGRFDRVVGFPNASEELRVQYFMRLTPFNEDKLRAALHDSPEMSFAQLKETYILAYQFAEKLGREDIVEDDLLLAITAMTKMLSVKASPIGIKVR